MIAWKGISPTHYRTTKGGAEARLFEDGWFALHGRRARGPLPDMLTAMDAAEELMARASRPEAEAAP